MAVHGCKFHTYRVLDPLQHEKGYATPNTEHPSSDINWAKERSLAHDVDLHRKRVMSSLEMESLAYLIIGMFSLELTFPIFASSSGREKSSDGVNIWRIRSRWFK